MEFKWEQLPANSLHKFEFIFFAKEREHTLICIAVIILMQARLLAFTLTLQMTMHRLLL